ARCTQSSAVRAPEVDEHDALEGARPCRARIRPAAELDGRQDRAHHRHRASEIQDRHDEPRLQHPPAGSARANGSCTRLSALTGGVRVASCKGPRGRRPGVKTVPDRGLTSERALQPPAQPRQKSLKASIVRGSHKNANAPQAAGLLRARRKRPASGRTGKKVDEIPAPHGLPPKAKDRGRKYSRSWSAFSPVHRSKSAPHVRFGSWPCGNSSARRARPLCPRKMG